tara:strand:- start:1992 stop:2168 length:177 start_codon:yes stop_codon:yes gene_type:complete
LAKEYKKIAKKMNFYYVNVLDRLEADFDNRSSDGIHLDSIGQKVIAQHIKICLDKVIN